MKAKLAVYDHVIGNGSTIRAFIEHDWGDDSNWIRLTEFVEIEFPELPAEEVVGLQLGALKKEQDAETERHARALADIEERKAKLLAITQQ